MNIIPFFAEAAGASLATTNSCNWSELAKLAIEDGEVKFTIGPLVAISGLIGFVIFIVWRLDYSKNALRDYEVVEAELEIAGLGKVTIRPNDEIVRIAYQAWVELSTRKIGLPYDKNHDVIVEVYDSWYAAFGKLRDLAKSIPTQKIQSSEDTQKLVDQIVKVLNDGLRPHLTCHRAVENRPEVSDSKPATLK